MNNVAAILDVMGQAAPRKTGDAALMERARDMVRAGFPASVIEKLADRFETSVREVQKLAGISHATAHRHRGSRAALRPVNSDRLLRMASVFTLARKLFGSDENAAGWFKEPNRALHGERPFDLLDTEIGVQQVIRILQRLEYGVYS